MPFLGVILLLGVFITVLGFYVIQRDIIDRTQHQVESALHAARSVYNSELEMIRMGFLLASHSEDLSYLKSKLDLDYLYTIESADRERVKSPVVAEAFRGNGNGGTRILASEEFSRMNNGLVRFAQIPVEYTPHARPTTILTLDKIMVMEYARPFFDASGRVARVIYGGKVINRRLSLVNRIRDQVFENRIYKSKPTGTVTIFLDDVRIATNVLGKDGKPAIGTRVSAEVYDNVMMKGGIWRHRAFVVTDWYLTAYEPITDVRGERIGILYVGVLEQPFTDMKRRIGMLFSVIIGAGVLLAAALSIVISGVIMRPITKLEQATRNLSQGNLEHRVEIETPITELASLTTAFNVMAHQLEERDDRLREANDKLTELNKNYLDMVGMVSHELKGILASTILNAYSIKDRFFGEINEKQEKALNSITRNLDYLTITVKRFLDLSRIEKGELIVHASNLKLRDDVFTVAIEAFQRQAQEKNMRLVNHMEQEMPVRGDLDMLQIVANNLIRNAIYYGAAGGSILINANDLGERLEIDIYNDGSPLSDQARDKLFRKFSRLDTAEGRKVRGTGLGLFVTRQIVEKHGGQIRCEPREHGNSFIFTIKKDCDK